MSAFSITCSLYFLVIIGLALYGYYKTTQYQDYLLGGRRFGSLVTAMGVAASDMSAWLMLGLPGLFYVYGLGQIWVPIGLLLGAYLNWQIVGPRLRVYTELVNNSLTLPAFLQQRVSENPGKYLRLIVAIIFLIFFTCYAASGFVAAATLVGDTFNFDYETALFISAPIVVLYTVVGGYLAVNWIDLLQGFLMLFALLLLAMLLSLHVSNDTVVFQQIDFSGGRFNIAHDFSLIAFVSAFAWGLGYFGQPHILSRFMSSNSEKTIRVGKYVCIPWMFLAFFCAVLIGMIGFYYFPQGSLTSPELIFPALTQHFFSETMSALVFIAIISAIMSTAAAVLFVAASSLVEDGYHVFISPKAQQKELVWMGRLLVLLTAMLAALLATLGENPSIFKLVSHAWGGLGAAFGPVILLSLYWSRLSHLGVILGMVMGGGVVLIWIYLHYHSDLSIFTVYELLPGFIAGMLGAILGTYLKPQTSTTILARHQDFLQRIRR